MSASMKARHIRREIRIQIGDKRPRLFLVPKLQADNVVRILENFEVDEQSSVSWQAPVQDLIDSYTEPGVALRGAREKEGLSQTAVAQKLGIPQPNVSEMESGRRPIGKKMAKRLSKILKINYKVFL